MGLVDSSLPTIQQAAANLLSTLQAIGIDDGEAHAESQLILEHCLALDLAQQLAHSDQVLTAEQLGCIDDICRQRKERMPLQYCLGYAYFWGMKLAVSPGVFIPRGDTETLVQTVLNKIRRRDASKLITDIGTGSGAIAIALAKELAGVKVAAIDISPQAIDKAKTNADTFGVAAQIDFLTGDWVSVLPNNLDFIVSNPPYLNDSHRVSMTPEITRYEPEAALYGTGSDGLGFYQELAKHSARHLKSAGEILLEIGDGQSQAVEQIFKLAGWKQIELHKDLNGLTRVLSAVRA
jgi:release factor glutamine methyltransferase